jgi:hypothetical protein
MLDPNLGWIERPTLVEALQARAATTPERTMLTWLGPDGAEEGRLSAAELDRRARRIAAALRRVAPAGARDRQAARALPRRPGVLEKRHLGGLRRAARARERRPIDRAAEEPLGATHRCRPPSITNAGTSDPPRAT